MEETMEREAVYGEAVSRRRKGCWEVCLALGFLLGMGFLSGCSKDDSKTDSPKTDSPKADAPKADNPKDDSPPFQIFLFAPAEARHGEKLSIAGEGFSAVASENNVALNGVAAEVVSATPHKIEIRVPKAKDCSGLLQVSVSGKTVAADEPFTYVPTATVSTLAGAEEAGDANGQGTSARFHEPVGLTLDTAGNLYVADRENHRIRKISPEGLVSTLAGPSFFDATTETQAQFSIPYGLTLDAAGNLYVADMGSFRIRKISPEGAVSTFAEGEQLGNRDGVGNVAQHGVPTGLTLDATGNLYMTDSWNHRIRKISPEGVVSTLAGSGPTGEDGGGFADGAGREARFNVPTEMATDAAGNLYVVDTWNHRIRKISPEGVVSTLAGSGLTGENNGGFADGVGAEARFFAPSAMALDAVGNLYVADMGNFRIRKISPKGLVSTVVGNGTQGHRDGSWEEARFSFIQGMAIDAAGNLYITDGNRIRKIVLE